MILNPIPNNAPPLNETITNLIHCIKQGENDHCLELMFTQWNSIKHFSILYPILKQEMTKKNPNFQNLIQKYEVVTNEIDKKEKDNLEKNMIKFQGDRVYTRLERQKRIRKYLEKKKKRNKKYFIRYEIRKTLANNRLRSKGKFVKNRKIDINKLIEMVKQDQE